MSITLAGAAPGVATRIDPAPVVAGCVMFALVLFLPQVLNDGDTLWQIRTGEWILDHRAIPSADPFSFTAGNTPWFAHEWLAEVLMALAHRMGGMRGIMVLTAAASGLTAAVLLHHLRRFLPGIYAVLGLVLALSNAAPSLLARPHVLAWPCLALWCGGLVAARANRTAPSFLLLPAMLLWVNLHGSFVLGLLLTGAFLVEALFDKGIDPRRVLTAWTAFLLAAWGVALLNPDFIGGVLFPFHLVSMQSLAWIGEWQPTDFSRLQPLELILLAGLALGLSGALTLPPLRLLMLLGLVHGALTHARNEQILGLIGALILAEPIGARLARVRAAQIPLAKTPLAKIPLAKIPLAQIPLAPIPLTRDPLAHGPAEALNGVWGGLTVAAACLAAMALLARGMVPLAPERTGAAFAAILDRVPAALRVQPVLNDYSLGGQLIFQGARPFVDSRADLYGDAFLTRYRALTAPDRAALDRALTEYGIAWTIFPSAHRIVPVLDDLPGWRRLAAAGGVVIHAREEPAPR